MAIQSIDDLYAANSAGRCNRADWNKITGAAGYTAGRWYESFSLGGYPVATTFPGTALACVNCSESAGDGTNKFGIPHGGNVSTLVKNLIILGAKTTAGTGVPATLKLVDLVSYWPGISMASAVAQNLTGTPSLTRWANGAGLRLALAIRTTSGATAHNLNLSYTNQSATAGRTLPGTIACTASAITPHLTHSGVAANNYGPELPLASGDTGVQNVASVTLSASSTAGTAVLLLYRVIADIELSIASLKSEKELANQFPSMPVIPDDACLGYILGAGASIASATNFTGNVDTVWG